MKVKIYENYKKDDNGNTTYTERIIDDIESINFSSNGYIYIKNKNDSEVIEANKPHYISDVVIVMDK